MTSESLDIAIIGMAGRFPGAGNIDEFWRNLCNGVESIAFFTAQEATAAGADPAEIADPHYVGAHGMLEAIERFDAAFFGFYPREAEILDPQQRLFLECAWTALEHAGYDTEQYRGVIGVYAGAGLNTYLLFNLFSNPEVRASVQDYQLMIGNDKDFLPTRVSYKLNLRGPSITVQTACSTSLVAVHQACQSLLNYQCDMALAGGVAIHVPQRRGYLYQEGGILSPDGHCRAFDARAQGTVGGSGLGIVVLKRLADAIADGDTIHAVLKGSAINNDGALKVGYTAPSVDGQAEVIATAQALAEVDPETISYIEAHGTGTALGDPIEITALTQVFRAATRARQFCAIGSVKTNVGHLDAAAGVTGLIKTVLALKHKLLPPSLHFEQPNPAIDFANSPFYVNTTLSEWRTTGGLPRRAGVSSFGIGGTNAHVIVEEAPPAAASGGTRPWQLLLLSARTETALETASANLAEYLRQHPDVNLADVAYTQQVGRRAFGYRRVTVCRDCDDGIHTLETLDPKRVFSACADSGSHPVVFMFTGQGAQYIDMALGLYQAEPTFRAQVDHCAELLTPHLGLDLRDVLYPGEDQVVEATRQLDQTWITQPALFVIEYALAHLWMEWGVRPQAMIGHSIGEYVAACLAGVFTLEDVLALVAARGRMLQHLPDGAMLSVALPEGAVLPLLDSALSLATVNGPDLCVVSGSPAAVESLKQQLAAQGVACRRLRTSHAFHSALIEPILPSFTDLITGIALRPPQTPFVSNVTGTWITAEEATDPGYWARHLRQTVRFADGIGELAREPSRVFLEVGPGHTLSTFVKQHPAVSGERVVLASLRHPQSRQTDDVAFMLGTLGRLWLAGVPIDWSGFYTHEHRRRVALPTYPFERQRYWIEAGAGPDGRVVRKKPAVTDWLYVPSWKRLDLARTRLADRQCWLVFSDASGLGSQMLERLAQRDQDVVAVTMAACFAQTGANAFSIDPRRPEDYVELITTLSARGQVPGVIAHLWGITPRGVEFSAETTLAEAHDLDFYSLLMLAQALGKHNITAPLQIGVVSTHLQEVTGGEALHPGKATLLGPCRVIPQEYPNITCRSIDIEAFTPETPQVGRLADRLITELALRPPDAVVAYRGPHRWVQAFAPIHPDGTGMQPARLRDRGVYLITGGLGRIGQVLAGHLARMVQARLVLVGRVALPARAAWAQWLDTHGEQDDVSRKIRGVQALEALGAEVLIAGADVADPEQMQAVIAMTDERFGALHGVIHAAGIVGDDAVRTIQELDCATCERLFRPKIRGTAVLEQLLAERELDFCLLCSSLSTALGGLGLAAYAAANQFMDTLAHAHNRTSPTPWISVNWDGWQFETEQRHAFGGTTLARFAITPEEGVAAFERILALEDLTQVIVSTGDLSARLSQWVAPVPVRAEERAEPAEAVTLHARPSLQNLYVAPRNEFEQTIASMWQQVLGIEQVGLHDDFFALGGHSLLATQVVSRLRDTYRVEIPLRSLFETPTVEGLAALIAASLQATAQPPAPTIPRIPRDGTPGLPLSFAQQRLWFLDQLEPGSPLYNNPATLRLTGQLDASALERSLNEIVRRHEVLRTTFDSVDGWPVQVIAPQLTLPLPVVDLRDQPAAEREAIALRLATEEAQRPFDLHRGPLLRSTLLRLADHEYILLLTLHHIVSDGWSTGVTVRELATLYTDFATGNAPSLPELPIQYADFAAWQRAWFQGEVLDTQLAYWQQQLRDAPPILDLPTDRPRPAIQTYRGGQQTFTVPGHLADALNALSRHAGATLCL